MVALIVALVAAAALVGGGGTVYAADGAAPGSALYGVDQAAEQVQYNLAGNDQSKAELKLAFAQERLLEARDLAEEGDVDGFGDALTGYDVEFTEAVSLLLSPSVDPQDAVSLLEASLEEQDETFDEIAQVCTDADGDLVDDVTGLPCSSEDDEEDNVNDNVGNENDNTDTNTNDNTDTNTNDNTDTGEDTEDEESVGCTGADPHPVGERLAEDYGVTYDEIMSYFCGTFDDEAEDGETSTCTDADGDLIDDVTGAACAPEPTTCTDDDQDGIDDVTGADCATDEEGDDTGKWHFGFGEIKIAFRISEESGVPVEELFAERLEGQGWGQLMQEYGLIGRDKGDDDEEDGDIETEDAADQPGNGKNGGKNGGKSGGDTDGDTEDSTAPSRGNGNGNGNSGGGSGNGGSGNGNGNSGGGGNGNGNSGGGNGNGNGNGGKNN